LCRAGFCFLFESLFQKICTLWQWVFPGIHLTLVPATKEYRRYHLHET